MARQQNFLWIADGENVDDQADYRPGRRAAKEWGVRSPLIEAELTKADIREISRLLRLADWNRPSCACLASRIPYDEPLTRAKLQQVDLCEDFIRTLGFSSHIRVRYGGDTARIEIEPNDISRFVEPEIRQKIIARFREIGFRYITLDLEGYSMGSMNRALNGSSDRIGIPNVSQTTLITI